MFFANYFDGCLPAIKRMHLDYNLTDQAYTFHLHENVIELVYIASGSGIYMINRQHFPVEKGDFMIIESGLIHAGASSPHSPMQTLALVVSDVRWKDDEAPNNVILPTSYPLIKEGACTPYLSSALMELWRMHQMTVPDIELMRMILAPLLVMLRKNYKDTKPYMKVRENPLACEILSYIYTHFSEDISLEGLSQKFYMSAGHISHLLQKEFQISPINYLIDVRFSKAKGFLINTDLPISQIAYTVGYNNPAHFTKLFIKRIGYSPLDYRMLHKNSCATL
ncbi:MAG TPA: AraC family transcriptional regulator [Clostridia bacterium]|nr:AraC family transcriptional regulator [Clostridia bacterium]